MQTDDWHILSENPKDLPEPGERVIICVGAGFIGEGQLKFFNGELKWERYCDFGPVENYMSEKVTAWTHFPAAPGKKRKTTEGKKTR